ncbi:hypothetical protein MNB_SV-6-672 [hydrothermal vent metagenome]|uniref:Uncharacterized protein n=1 Tax=hydrothermal vent metagenome TaxID=652676 RepID=A0A1W1BQL0_9ZZZZ
MDGGGATGVVLSFPILLLLFDEPPQPDIDIKITIIDTIFFTTAP